LSLQFFYFSQILLLLPDISLYLRSHLNDMWVPLPPSPSSHLPFLSPSLLSSHPFSHGSGSGGQSWGCQARPAKIRMERRGPAGAGFATVRPGPTTERSVARGRWPGAYLVRDGECGLAGADRRGDLRA
jgi:hypothetical protein